MANEYKKMDGVWKVNTETGWQPAPRMQAEILEKEAKAKSVSKKKKDAQIKLKDSAMGGKYGPISEASTQNADGSWSRPGYNTILDPKTGLLTGNFQLDNNLNNQGLDKYRTEALRDAGTDSAWAKMAMEQGELSRVQNQNDLGAQLNSSQRGAFDNLAAQGGLDAGSRLSIARGGLRDFMRGKQELNSQAQQNNLGIRTTDEENRMKQLSSLPGMEINKSTFDSNIQQKNIEGGINERRYAFDNEMKAWEKNQEVWGAQKQAAAQSAASGGCFVAGTLVAMEDGSLKPIEDIKLGERVLLGGKVLERLEGLSKKGDDWYNLYGTIVSGSHLILSDDGWIQSRDHESAQEALRPEAYYNLTTETHVLWINETLFSDMQDVDNYELNDLDAMSAKNDKWSEGASA